MDASRGRDARARRRRVAAAALAGAASLLPTPAAAQTGDVARVHDPAIAREGDDYYLFSTGPGIPVRRSRDLVHWSTIGRVFFPGPLPAWAEREVPGTRSPWAPDVSHFGGKYHLYYSVSTFGSNRSVIGLATNVTLNPLDPAYHWVDEGKVVESTPGVTNWNAIDPNVALDERGEPWLSWGSFWGGIKLRRLDPATGKLSGRDTTLHTLAVRPRAGASDAPPGSTAIEAPFIVRHGGWYWLFVSFDLCCRRERSTYNIRVGRSRRITGPYVDRAGVPMTEGGGTLVLAGAGRVRGPGHNAVLQEGDRAYLVHHYYDAGDRFVSKLQIRPLTWDAEGWPVAGEPVGGGTRDEGREMRDERWEMRDERSYSSLIPHNSSLSRKPQRT